MLPSRLMSARRTCPGATSIGGTTAPVMTTSPARSASPFASSTSVSARSTPIMSPVRCVGSVVRAISVPSPKDASVEAADRAAFANRPEQHMPVKDVAGEDLLQVRDGGIEVNQLDRRPQPGDGAVLADMSRDLRLEDRP